MPRRLLCRACCPSICFRRTCLCRFGLCRYPPLLHPRCTTDVSVLLPDAVVRARFKRISGTTRGCISTGRQSKELCAVLWLQLRLLNVSSSWHGTAAAAAAAAAAWLLLLLLRVFSSVVFEWPTLTCGHPMVPFNNAAETQPKHC